MKELLDSRKSEPTSRRVQLILAVCQSIGILAVIYLLAISSSIILLIVGLSYIGVTAFCAFHNLAGNYRNNLPFDLTELFVSSVFLYLSLTYLNPFV